MKRKFRLVTETSTDFIRLIDKNLDKREEEIGTQKRFLMLVHQVRT